MNAVGVSATLILSVGYDPVLLGTRRLLLQSAGYIVESSGSVENAIYRFRTGDFDLVVLCHSMPEQERRRLLHLIRDYGSATPVIFISSAEPSPDGFSDLSIENHPAALLDAVRAMLLRKKT